MSFEALVQSWVAATKGRNIATGLSVEDAMSQAKELLRRLGHPGAETRTVESEPIDVIYAMCRFLESGDFTQETLKSAYGFVVSLQWPEDEFCERDQLLAQLAYLAWNDCRLRADFRAMKQWQGRCISSVTNQEVDRNFLALPFAERSPSLNGRFLSESPVLLAACTALEKGRNTQPAVVLREATSMYKWLTSQLKASTASEEIRYFAGNVAYSAAGCCRHLGRFREHDSWLEVARTHFAGTRCAEPFLARLKWSRLVALHDLHRSGEVIDEIPILTATFRHHGMEDDELRSTFLEAHALKALGRHFDSLRRFEVVRSAETTAEDPLLLGLTLAAMGELTAQLGEPQRALQILRGALPLLEEAGAALGLGTLHATMAEVLRNEGVLNAAVAEYEKSIAIYGAAGFSFQTAYLRLLFADTLLAAGREDDAVRELTAAFPVIEREGAVIDGVAALALLKESLRRKSADTRALAQLRKCLSPVKRVTWQ